MFRVIYVILNIGKRIPFWNIEYIIITYEGSQNSHKNNNSHNINNNNLNKVNKKWGINEK